MISKLNQLKEEFKWADCNGDFDKLQEISDEILKIDPSQTDYKKSYIPTSYEKTMKIALGNIRNTLTK